MTRLICTKSVALAFWLAPASALVAQTTPEALWQDWQGRATAAGNSLTADESTNASGQLVLSNLVIGRTEADQTANVTLESLTLAPRGDGGVDVVLPGSQKIILTYEEAGASDQMVFGLREKPLTLTTGTGGVEGSYSVTSEMFGLDLLSVTEGGEELPVELALGIVDLNGVMTGFVPDLSQQMDVDLSAGMLQVAFDFADPVRGTRSTSASSTEDVKLIGSATPGATPSDWTGNGTMRAGRSQASSIQADPTIGRFETDATQDSTLYNFAYGNGRASFDGEALGIDATIKADALPVPQFTASLARVAAVFDLPTAPAETDQTANVAIALGDLVLDETLWSLVDPTHALPRTPANLDADLTVSLAISDTPFPGTPPAPEGMPNILPKGFAINRLALSFADAAAEAQGAFSFPISGTGLPDMNAPVGSLNVSASGIMTLLQRLTAAGILPAEQAMGAQMMLGMFATPGEGDTLTSTIETKPDGALLVNGNRLR